MTKKQLYYNKTQLTPRLHARYPLAYFMGKALLSPDDIIIKDFSQDVGRSDTIWMINTTGFGNYQPSLPDNWIKKEEKSSSNICVHCDKIIVSKYQVQKES